MYNYAFHKRLVVILGNDRYGSRGVGVVLTGFTFDNNTYYYVFNCIINIRYILYYQYSIKYYVLKLSKQI